jgi:hypothetical protein
MGRKGRLIGTLTSSRKMRVFEEWFSAGLDNAADFSCSRLCPTKVRDPGCGVVALIRRQGVNMSTACREPLRLDKVFEFV